MLNNIKFEFVQAFCLSLISACKWSYVFNLCFPFQCQDYNYEEQCKNVLIYLFDHQSRAVCGQNSKCLPFVETYYRFDAGICYITILIAHIDGLMKINMVFDVSVVFNNY
ncbi:unnamed protein product [Paramecium pentaurelia]|uniref:Uncharacterized protein n=1 Tax=Paramecium pentaurelia TaxID=43138 RepID=A0A8S1YER0_9CILI|nr:unnamed protein product [Paramecium pentaurelia]